MSIGGDVAKAAVVLFVAAILQVAILDRVVILHATPDLLLVTLVGLSLQRGSLFGAAGGFFAGLLVDTADLGTIGLTSLLLTIAGYWIGRYGETTGRDRSHAPFLSVAVVTVAVSLGQLVLHFMIGDHVSARLVLLDALAPAIALNLLLTPPVYALSRRLFRPIGWGELSTEVRLLG